MTLREHYRKNLQLAIPVVIGQLGHITVGLADSIMIGKLGTDPLAAVSFANSVFIVPMVFGMGMTFGMTTPIANADGRGNMKRVSSFFRHGLALHSATAVALVAILALFVPLLPFMGQEQAVVELAGPYLLLLASSLLPLMAFFTFKQFAEGLSFTRFAMLASIVLNLFNVFLNWLLIYGNWGFPAWGLNGAGVATLISRVLMAIAMGWYVFYHRDFSAALASFPGKAWERTKFLRLWRIGAPTGLQYIFEVSAFAVAAVMMGWISAEALAAHQIAISLASVSYMAASGIGAAATVRVGNQLGRRDPESLRMAAHTCFILTLLLMAFAGLVFFSGRFLLPEFYSDDPVVLDLAAQLLIVAVVFQLFDGMQATTLGALRGMAETQIPTLITFLSYWVIGLGTAYTMSFVLDLGALGIWYGLASGLFAASVLLFWRFEWRSLKLLHGKK